MSYSLEDKLIILGISNERELELSTMIIENIFIDDDGVSPILEEIDLSKLVGLNRRSDSADNWLELLDKLHKMRNFDVFKKDNFKKF
ncbi:hypothetical protein FDB29_08740 [Clostridium botulinum]|nr:hypothetical protein [Clostridium botulinum]